MRARTTLYYCVVPNKINFRSYSAVMCQLGAGACLPAALLDRIYVALHGASRFECTTLQVGSVIWVPDPWIRNALCHLVLELFTEIGQGACHLAQIV